jgi:hypothetical protein
MSKYRCSRCGKDFEQKSHYNNHQNRKIKCIEVAQNCTFLHNLAHSPVESNTTCQYCGKIFSRIYTLNRHIDGFCKVKKSNDAKMEDLMETMINMKNELQQITTKMNKLEMENSTYKKIIQSGNINNGNQINYNINIVPYGSEDINQISAQEYKRIFNRGCNSVPALMEKLHFDKNKPENHNVYISNMRDDYVLVYDGKKWRLRNREDILQQLYEDKADILETKFEELLGKLDEQTIRMFKRFIKIKDTDEEAIKRIKKDLKTILYENRDMIKKTKKLINTKSIKNEISGA